MNAPAGLVIVAGTLQVGGAERQLHAQCKVLATAGAAPTVVFLEDGPWHPRLEELGVELVDLSQVASRGRRLVEIILIARRKRCRMVQSSHGFTNVYAAAAGRALRISSIGALRDDPVATARQLGRWAGPAFRWPTLMVGNSRAGLRGLDAWGVSSDDTFYLPNAVDPEEFTFRERTDQGVVTVGFVGRLVARKNPEVVVDLVADLVGSGLSVRGLVVGDGPLAADVDRRIRERGVGAVVERRGASGDVAAALGEMDLLVLASDHEGMPNVVLEAMATGLPVVATDVGSVAEAVEDDRSGRIVCRDDPQRLSSTVRELVEHTQERHRLGSAAATRVRAEFSPQRLTTAMNELYGLVGSR